MTTARDIALMSRELIEKYPKIHDYCMIWMDTITHTTKKGTSEFGLSNTNKLGTAVSVCHRFKDRFHR